MIKGGLRGVERWIKRGALREILPAEDARVTSAVNGRWVGGGASGLGLWSNGPNHLGLLLQDQMARITSDYCCRVK